MDYLKWDLFHSENNIKSNTIKAFVNTDSVGTLL